MTRRLSSVRPASVPLIVRSRRSGCRSRADGPYRPRVHLNADVAMVYGIDKTLPDRIKAWRDEGYIVQVMTGVAWGEYQDYYFGRWDGKNREDEAQQMKNGERIGHGGDIYYISPGEDYGRYLVRRDQARSRRRRRRRFILKSPNTGYVPAGQAASSASGRSIYDEPWIAPDSSPDAQYRASKLKYYLYETDAGGGVRLREGVRQGAQPGHQVLCPDAFDDQLRELGNRQPGIVAARTSVRMVSLRRSGPARRARRTFTTASSKQRTFETAFLEYGAMQNIVRASGKRVWYLNDPIEDNAAAFLVGLSHELGEHAGRVAASAGGVALRDHALAAPHF